MEGIDLNTGIDGSHDSVIWYPLFRESITSSAFGSYFWDACKRAQLFSSSTYTNSAWRKYSGAFLLHVAQGIELPPGMKSEEVCQKLIGIVTERMEKEKLLKEIEDTEVKDAAQVRRLFERARSFNEERLPRFIESFRSDEYPPILWIEFGRAISSYLDGMRFLGLRMKKLGERRPRNQSETFARNKLTKLMVGPIENVLASFLDSIVEFYRVFISMDAWNSASVQEILTDKKIDLQRVPPAVFETRMSALQDSVTLFRHHLRRFEHLTKPPLDPTVDDAYRRIMHVWSAPLVGELQ